MVEKTVKFYGEFDDTPKLLWEERVKILDWGSSYPTGALIPFGQVTPGSLTLKGHVREVLLMPHVFNSSSPIDRERPSDTLWPALAMDLLTTLIVGEAALDSQEISQNLIERYRGSPESEHKSELDSTLHGKLPIDRKYEPWALSKTLPALCLLTSVLDDSGYRSIVALVLTPHDITKQKYRRIGLMFAKDKALLIDVSYSGSPNPDEEKNRKIVHIV